MYTVAIAFIVVRMRGANSGIVLRNAALFGTATGVIEIANIAIEHALPFAVSSPVLQTSVPLLIFSLWAFWISDFEGALIRTLRPFHSASVQQPYSSRWPGLTMEFFWAPPRPTTSLWRVSAQRMDHRALRIATRSIAFHASGHRVDSSSVWGRSLVARSNQPSARGAS